MVDTYTIYLQNETVSTKVFWCFLERPQQLVDDPKVFANSSASLAVAPHAPSTNTFTIPVQYLVGAGASNQAVDLGIKIESSIQLNASLDEQFSATYANVPPNLGPTLVSTGSGAGSNQISIKSNSFEQANNEANGWFASQTFGIQTAQGFIGMSWSPDPNFTRTLTPKLKFFVAVGDYGSNKLASWNTINNDSVELDVPIDFNLRKVTVTLQNNGTWRKEPGEPTTHPLVTAMAHAGLAVNTAY